MISPRASAINYIPAVGSGATGEPDAQNDVHYMNVDFNRKHYYENILKKFDEMNEAIGTKFGTELKYLFDSANGSAGTSKAAESMRHEMNRFLYPLVRDWKIYFCHDCVIDCDDVKLHNMMYRSFEHGVINFRSDDSLNTNCICCSRMLNTQPTINKFFPHDKNDISSVQGLLNYAHEGVK